MGIRTKMALMYATGLLSVTGIAGFGTYALFTSQTQNTNNNFTAGTLQMTAERDDISQAGPMFYSTSALGAIPTGLWAPGDKHTRGMFVENTGSLSAKLSTISATPANASGNPVSSGTSYNNDMTFAKQANVNIWKLEAYNPVTAFEEVFTTNGNTTPFENAVDEMNYLYQFWVYEHPGLNPATDSTAANSLLNFVNVKLLQTINNVSAVASNGTTVTHDSVQVVQIAFEPLANLVNHQIYVSSNLGGTPVAPNKSTFLAFTVSLYKEPPVGVGRNSLQGLSSYFNFGTNWVQSRNN